MTQSFGFSAPGSQHLNRPADTFQHSFEYRFTRWYLNRRVHQIPEILNTTPWWLLAQLTFSPSSFTNRLRLSSPASHLQRQRIAIPDSEKRSNVWRNHLLTTLFLMLYASDRRTRWGLIVMCCHITIETLRCRWGKGFVYGVIQVRLKCHSVCDHTTEKAC